MGLVFEGLQDPAFRLLAKAGQPLKPAVLCRSMQLPRVLDSELVVDELDPLWSQPGQLRQLDQPVRNFLAQLRDQGHRSGFDDALDLSGKVGADSRQIVQAFSRGQHARDLGAETA
jgi:hypothetical protein